METVLTLNTFFSLALKCLLYLEGFSLKGILESRFTAIGWNGGVGNPVSCSTVPFPDLEQERERERLIFSK